MEAIHLFCEAEDATLVCSIETRDMPVPIASISFIVLEIPNDPMDVPGYRIFSRGK